jgi:lipid II:glycine glycyltransferase (peptidoglycan interpeptide bridge formation enzyme)
LTEWEQHASCFADYSIYQTWAYQEARAAVAGHQVSRVVIKDQNNTVVAMCHVRIMKVSGLAINIGYVQRGPLMQAKDGRITCSAEALKVLRETYLKDKVHILRVVPNPYDDQTGQRISQMLKDCGFESLSWVPRYRTLMLPLDGSEEEIRGRLDRNFRRNLKKAERAGLDIREGRNCEFCGELRELYGVLVKRKGFAAANPDEFIKPQLQLSPAERMNFVVAYHSGEPVSVHVGSNLGTTGVALLTASNTKGLVCGASYLTWWKACVAAKNAGMKRYDLGGIDPQKNPGCYQFKSQISQRESLSIGAFEAYRSPPVRAVWHASTKVHALIKSIVLGSSKPGEFHPLHRKVTVGL